jgi:hypothetical protein
VSRSVGRISTGMVIVVGGGGKHGQVSLPSTRDVQRRRRSEVVCVWKRIEEDDFVDRGDKMVSDLRVGLEVGIASG